jgi:hypothetical protein
MGDSISDGGSFDSLYQVEIAQDKFRISDFSDGGLRLPLMLLSKRLSHFFGLVAVSSTIFFYLAGSDTRSGH